MIEIVDRSVPELEGTSFQESANINPVHNGVLTLDKAMGDELRLNVLKLLSTESLGVLELTRALNTRQSGLSHHLKVLANAGLVSKRREGNSIFYRRALPPTDSTHGLLIQALFEAIDETPLVPVHKERLGEIRQSRAELSRAFFSRHARAFEQHQELIAEHELYAHMVLEMITHVQGTPDRRRSVLELGPGEGLFLPMLSR